jgi:lipid-A-disaccharide synthase-like uncharacterized protein
MTELLLAYTWMDLFKAVRGEEPVGWLVFGFCGNAAFFTRFLVQWVHSERAGESRIPEIFWWQSIVGTLILLTYFVHRRDPVGMLGYVVNVVPYTRNLVLVYRKKRELRRRMAGVGGGAE